MARYRLALLGASWLAYMVFTLVGHPFCGVSMMLYSILLCGFATWLYGYKTGLLTLILSHPCNMLAMLYHTGSLLGWQATLEPGWITAQLLAVFFIGTVKNNRSKSLELAESLEKCTRQRNEELKKIAEHMITQSAAERSKMSKMLCNIVAYQQTGLLYHSEALMNFLVYNNAPQADDATKLVQIAEQNIEQVKNITKRLSPQKTVDPGIEQNLHRMSRFFTETVGTRFSMMISNRCGDIPDAVALHLCRIAHEAVTNALRHGKATRIWLALELDDTTCTLIVENNGNPIPQSPTEGIGTRLIQQRAEIIHATTRLETSSSGQTRFECTAPLRSQTPPEFRLPIWPPVC